MTAVAETFGTDDPYLPSALPKEPPHASGRLIGQDLEPLVRAAGQRDQRAIRRLLRILQPLVIRYCRARLGGRDLAYLSADDVARNVCVAVLEALPEYRERGGSFLYLVHAIAAGKVAGVCRNVARDHLLAADDDTEAPVVRDDLGSRLRQLLTWLAPAQQEVLILRIIVGFSAAETAEALGISVGSVRAGQHRALGKLRDMVQDEEF